MERVEASKSGGVGLKVRVGDHDWVPVLESLGAVVG
jgi:hypothetical protein